MNQSISVTRPPIEATVLRAPILLDQLSDYELIEHSMAGIRPERATFGELMRRYQSYVDQLLYHLAPDWQDRADLAQEVWIRVYRYINRLQEPKKFRCWLSRIATNLFYDELRRRKRVSDVVSLSAPHLMDDGEMDWEFASNNPTPDQDLTAREFYEQLLKALANLSEAYRTTIVLREIEGLAYEEIAQITGVSLGTVKSRIARARDKMQFQLQNYLDESVL